MTKSNPLFAFIFLCLILSARLLFDFINAIEIHYDEAQYWVWSQNLSLSYLSKGPLVPLMIAFSNLVFGQSFLGLKFFSYTAYAGTILLLSLTASRLSGKEDSFKTALLFSALSPGLFFLGGVASTDIYLFFFWSLTIFAYVCFFKDRDEKWFYVIGISTGLGILAKLSMVLLPLSILLYFFATDLKKYFLNIHIYLSALLAILISSPILIWNAQNNWVTFFHEIDHLVSEIPSSNPEILIVTMLLTVPCALLIFMSKIREKVLSSKFSYLIYPTLLMLLFFLVKSFTGKIQLNWSIPVFLGLIPIFASIASVERRGVLLSLLFLSPIILLSNKTLSSMIIPEDPLHPMRGWNETYQELLQNEDYDFLASEDYKLLSTAAYFEGAGDNIFLTKSSNRRLTHYDLWKTKPHPSDKILFIEYSAKEASFDLNCKKIREVKNFHRKHLTLYNCSSK